MNRMIMYLFMMALLAACALSQTTGTDSGVEGKVTIGPMCPVVRIDQPCPDQPYQATFTVFNPTGKKITEVQSDVDGLYRIILQPGDYILHPESTNAMPYAQDQPFTVVVGQFTKVDIVYDSGIR